MKSYDWSSLLVQREMVVKADAMIPEIKKMITGAKLDFDRKTFQVFENKISHHRQKLVEGCLTDGPEVHAQQLSMVLEKCRLFLDAVAVVETSNAPNP